MSYLKRLEDESVHIIREVVAECRAPVMLYTHRQGLRRHAAPGPPRLRPGSLPFPLLHIDTGWKFREMIAMRDQTARDLGLRLIVHTNREAQAAGVNPFDHGSAHYTQRHEDRGAAASPRRLHGFDAAFGGARRDEETSRAKERIFSFRTAAQAWDPKNQRPEFWSLYNGRVHPGESIRVFPLSNWTELDIWTYIEAQEHIPVVPLYFAHEQPVVERDGSLIAVHDERMALHPGESPGPPPGPLPLPGLLPAQRRRPVRRRDHRRHRAGDRRGPHDRARRTPDRP